MKEKPSDRLRMARERAGFKTAAAFAAAHNLPESTYRSADNGTRGLRLSAAKQYAPLLGVTWQWLMDGGEMPKPRREISGEGRLSTGSDAENFNPKVTTAEINIQHMPRDVPILGGASCGENGLFELNGQTLDHVRRPPRLIGVRDIYALYVHGESMAPWREPGGLVYVHPHQPVKIGDYVVVQLQPEGSDATPAAYIKRLVRRTADHLVLMQYNPKSELKIASKKVKAVHRIMDWDELLGI